MCSGEWDSLPCSTHYGGALTRSAWALEHSTQSGDFENRRSFPTVWRPGLWDRGAIALRVWGGHLRACAQGLPLRPHCWRGEG